MKLDGRARQAEVLGKGFGHQGKVVAAFHRGDHRIVRACGRGGQAKVRQ